jgi:hypothetical protein
VTGTRSPDNRKPCRRDGEIVGQSITGPDEARWPKLILEIEMNAQQQRKIEWLTSRVDADCRYTSGDQEYRNGPVIHYINTLPNGEVQLCSSNATNELRWFETSCRVIAFVGKRGGIKIADAEGISTKYLK